MIKRKNLDLVLGISLVVLLGFFINDHFINPKVKNSNERIAITKANDILRRKSVIPPDFLNNTATSNACTMYLKRSSELSMNEYTNEFIDHHVDEILKTCSGAFPNQLQEKIDRAILNCQTSTREKISKDCYGALLEAKTSCVAVILKKEIDPHLLPASLLLHLIAYQYSTGDFIAQPEKSIYEIDELLEKEPLYYGGYKLKLLLLATSSLNKNEHYNEHYRDIFLDTLEEAKRLQSIDPDVTEIVLSHRLESINRLPKSELQRKQFISYLTKESMHNPKEWIYDYYKANAIFQNGLGDKNRALQLLNEVIKKDPRNPRLKQTLQNFASDDELISLNPFIISIKFSLDDL